MSVFKLMRLMKQYFWTCVVRPRGVAEHRGRGMRTTVHMATASAALVTLMTVSTLSTSAQDRAAQCYGDSIEVRFGFECRRGPQCQIELLPVPDWIADDSKFPSTTGHWAFA